MVADTFHVQLENTLTAFSNVTSLDCSSPFKKKSNNISKTAQLMAFSILIDSSLG
jgi:hypothetical protein